MQTDDRIYLKKILPLSCLVLMWFAWFCTILCFHSDDPLCNSVNKSNNRRHLKRAPESRPAAEKRDHQGWKIPECSGIMESNFRITQTLAPGWHWSDWGLCHHHWPDLTSAASSIWRLIKDLLMMYNVCHQISHNLKGGLKSKKKDEKVETTTTSFFVR